jgi:ankyrin repeat protein
LSDDAVIPPPPPTNDERDENEPSGVRYPTKEEREDSTVDIFKAFEMFQLIEKGNWKELAKHVKKYPQSSFVRMTQGSKGYNLTSKGNLLLHEVCRYEPSLELVDAIISVNNGALKAIGEYGRMPLHYACACGASGAVVRRLINAFPQATKLRDGGDLMLPLHLACKWGASKEVIEELLSANSDGRKIRDIFGKIPLDYAKQLGLKENRDNLVECLQAQPRKVTFNDRTSPVKNNAINSTVKQEMKTQVLNENTNVKNSQHGQDSRMKALEDEYKTLRSLQTGNKQKMALLEKKLEVLIKANEVKQQLIERLEHENNVKYNQELNNALSEQEQQFVELLNAEKNRIADLENHAKEIEITHRMYTEAILEEHDVEAAEFEQFTLQFRDLESQLRARLVDAEERNDFLETEVIEKTKKFKELITAEREKVSFLEGHVDKVNELLESEQKRFQELEAILKQTIDAEDEQREEMAEEFRMKEEHYKLRLREEQAKVAVLQRDYEEVRGLLAEELERFSFSNDREGELRSLIEMQQKKLREMQNTEQLLESERERSQSLQKSEEQAWEELAAEQDKVKDLEMQLRAVQNELEVERAAVEKLRELLEKKQTEYETEKKKVKALQAAQANKSLVLESLQHKVSILEEALEDTKSIADQENDRLEQAWCELEEVKWALEKEKEQVQELSISKRQLENFLQCEKQKVKNLEQAQVVAEAEIQLGGVGGDSQAKLVENQKLLNIERARVANLKVEQSQLDSVLQSKTTKLLSLESRLMQKEEQLKSDRRKFEALEKQLLETEDILQSEQKRAGNLEKEHREIQVRLVEEEKQVQDLETQLIEARSHIESVEIKMNTLGEAREEMREVFNTAEREKIIELEKLLSNYRVQLDAEQELIQELEMELSDARQVCDDEKRRVAELKEQFEKASSELASEKKLVDTLAQDRAKTHVILESEQIKVKALEHARDQLKALLDWEKKNLKTNLQKHKDAEGKLSAVEKQLAKTASAFENKTVTVEYLSKQLEGLGELRKEVIRLNSEGRHKDFLLANILKAVGSNLELRGNSSVKEAKDHSDLLTKIIGFDLSSLEETAVMEQGALIKSAPRDVAYYRRLRRTLFWTIPLIPLIAVSQDPSIIEGITSQLDPQMLQDLTANIATMASNFDPAVMRDMARGLTANIARNIDPAIIRETIPQMFGMATSVATEVVTEVVTGGGSGGWMQI